jgi:hypothetical protein
MARAGSPSAQAEGLTASPPPPVISKRDKRRNMLSDRLQQMMDQFGYNLRPHYEGQTNALQVDMMLIMRENPYQNQPLDEDNEAIRRKISDITSARTMGDSVTEAAFQHDVGREYSSFVNQVNTAMEEKDTNLALLAVRQSQTQFLLPELTFVGKIPKHPTRTHSAPCLPYPSCQRRTQISCCHPAYTSYFHRQQKEGTVDERKGTTGYRRQQCFPSTPKPLHFDQSC